jgi:3-methylfumaryl-CoA hydratase
MDGTGWQDWVGRSEVREDRIDPTPIRALAATLNRSTDISAEAGAAISPVWLWLYFLPLAPMAEIGADGHPRRGGFLPPIALPRRMWAGSRCSFDAIVRIGDTVERTSTIQKISEKTGKAGSMVFVTVRHDTHVGSALAMREEQDIVYLPMPERFSLPEPTPLPACDWREAVAVDPVLLFRFSALTFNGHRIHYDRPYAMDVEKYPGLVVHGPLQALLLFEAGLRHAPGRRASRFEFRGIRPLFDFDALTLNGRMRADGGVDLFTANADAGDAISMQASLQFTAD